MSEEAKTIELEESKPAEKAEPKKSPTRDELKSQGWSHEELEKAEKRGMIHKEEKEKKNPKPEKQELEQEKKGEEVKQEEQKPKSTLPDFTFKTPEQEKVFLEAFGQGTPQRAMYLRMKSERRDRQKAQEERDRIKLENQVLKDRLDSIESKQTKKVEVEEGAIDPDDQPLTPRMMREMEEKREKERQKKDEELRSQGSKVALALQEQEEFARSNNPDYDETVGLAKEVITNLDEIITDAKTQRKILKLWQDLQYTSANADKLSVDDYNAADISYEIGKLHPNWGKTKNGHSADDGKPKDPKANGSLTPEQMKRIETNTQRRASSASLSGGNGRRTVAVEDLTVADILKMSREQRDKLRKEHPDKFNELLRGK